MPSRRCAPFWLVPFGSAPLPLPEVLAVDDSARGGRATMSRARGAAARCRASDFAFTSTRTKARLASSTASDAAQPRVQTLKLRVNRSSGDEHDAHSLTQQASCRSVGVTLMAECTRVLCQAREWCCVREQRWRRRLTGRPRITGLLQLLRTDGRRRSAEASPGQRARRRLARAVSQQPAQRGRGVQPLRPHAAHNFYFRIAKCNVKGT